MQKPSKTAIRKSGMLWFIPAVLILLFFGMFFSDQNPSDAPGEPSEQTGQIEEVEHVEEGTETALPDSDEPQDETDWMELLSADDPFGHSAKTCPLESFSPSSEDPSQTRAAFREAFAACANGTVVVGAGTWTTGGITIPGNVTLRLERGARVVFDPDPEHYLPAVPTRFEGMDVMNYQPLIYIPNARNVAIVGQGAFVGNGSAWWGARQNKRADGGMDEKEAAKVLYKLVQEDVPLEDRVFASMKKPLRPSFIQPYKSANILIRDVTFIESPMWTVHPLYTKNLAIRGIEVDTEGRNTDGIAIDSSRNVLIEDVRISSGDDAIVIKSGLDHDGWREDTPSENITIRDVDVLRGNGGVTIGSEMSGGVENVSVESAKFHNTDTGIRLKTLEGRGGYIRNLSFRDIVMENIIEDAIKLDATYSSATFSSASDRHPDVRNILIEDIRVRGAERAIRIDGGPFGFSRVTLRSGIFDVDTAGSINDISDLVWDDMTLRTKDSSAIEMQRIRYAFD